MTDQEERPMPDTDALTLPPAVSDELVAPAIAALPSTGSQDTDAAIRVAVIDLVAAAYNRGLADGAPKPTSAAWFHPVNTSAFSAATALVPTRDEITAIARAVAEEVLVESRQPQAPLRRTGRG